MHHIYKIIDLCGLIGMAGASEDYNAGTSKGFVIGYMGKEKKNKRVFIQYVKKRNIDRLF